MKSYLCLTCQKSFSSYKAQKGRVPKFCSHPCYAKSLSSEKNLKNLAYARSFRPIRKIKEKKIRTPKIIYRCQTCSNEFKVKGLDRIPKFCSRKCFQIREKPPETIKKMAEAKKGKAPWNKDKKMWDTRPHPKGTLGKSIGKGKTVSQETRKKQRDSHLNIKLPERSGENHHFWRGGITPQNMSIRKSLEYTIWRRSVYERDSYTCQICNQIGGRLCADHILPFSLFPDKRFDLNNGRTLCHECHLKTPTYGRKVFTNAQNA